MSHGRHHRSGRHRVRRILGIGALGAALGIASHGCGGEAGGGNPADSLTRRERDSLIGESALPGAAGVRGALRAADSAAARNRRADTIRDD